MLHINYMYQANRLTWACNRPTQGNHAKKKKAYQTDLNTQIRLYYTLYYNAHYTVIK